MFFFLTNIFYYKQTNLSIIYTLAPMESISKPISRSSSKNQTLLLSSYWTTVIAVKLRKCGGQPRKVVKCLGLSILFFFFWEMCDKFCRKIINVTIVGLWLTHKKIYWLFIQINKYEKMMITSLCFSNNDLVGLLYGNLSCICVDFCLILNIFCLNINFVAS